MPFTGNSWDLELSGGGSSPSVVRHGEGCVECRHSGYRGRSAIYEMIEVNDPVQKLIMQQSDANAIKRQAVADGMTTLRQAAVRKLLDGTTSYEEVISITRPD